MRSVLVVDTHLQTCNILQGALEDAGYSVQVATTGADGLALLQSQSFDLVLAEADMPRVGGFELLAATQEMSPSPPLILMGRQASLRTAMRAVNEGASYFLVHPFSAEQVCSLCASVLLRAGARPVSVPAPQNEVPKPTGARSLGDSPAPVGQNPALLKMLALARKVAPTGSTVLISGESGTGKEVLARYLHHSSSVSSGPFVSINCGAIPESLLESELFGHVKGSFTGAVRDKQGLFQAANGGTLFLDEIGELSPSLQVKLLRAIQEREVVPVGGTVPVPVQVRIIAATNRELREEVRQNRFRSDLFFRLNVFQLRLPALRERMEDLETFCDLFLLKCERTLGLGDKILSEEALSCLMGYDWPGNVRELENAIEYAYVLADRRHIEPRHLPEWVSVPQQALVGMEPHPIPSMDLIERAYIQWVLAVNQGNRSKAAAVLGLDPSTLYRKMARWSRSPEEFTHLSLPTPAA